MIVIRGGETEGEAGGRAGDSEGAAGRAGVELVLSDEDALRRELD